MCSSEGGRHIRWTPHPEIVTIRDNRDYIEVLLYSYYTTLTGWRVLLTDTSAIVLMRSSLFERGTADGGCYGFRV